ncbi:2-oxoacid:acceptor oxidoreductase subunit alpha [Candidatus Gottesmanbacteria bacterium]|nr:2-oxoacid:acceptor oxidoreductase subunit alpha [Candidatus Gottesmanbacteria bacterium]
MESVTWKIGGEAGFGIMASGTMLARAMSRAGYFVFAFNEYPSLIRGGHNVVTMRIATGEFAALNRDVHILVALNDQTVERHKDEVSDGALILFDPQDHEWQTSDFSKNVVLLPIPLRTMVAQKAADPVMRNTITLGATMALLGRPFEALSIVISDQFKRKGQEVVDANVAIAKLGFDYVKEKFSNITSMTLTEGKQNGRKLLINGSEAVGVGAVRAGLKFAAIYPMTPINSLITFLADHASKLKLVYKQPEDEIAGINMAIGASVAGARSMVATSGGGFALMVEGLSLAGMIEVPLVIDMGMRVGPATGMPTYTEQGELQFLIHAGHGEFARILLAPGDAAEAYKLTIDAFHLADQFQIPVFLVTDKYLNESQWCVNEAAVSGSVAIDRGKLVHGELPADGSFKRYEATVADGVSARSLPGMKNGQYYANSYEHDETGHVTEKAQGRAKMVEKRLRKLAAIQKMVPPPTVYGDADAEVSLVTWGSMKGPVLEAMQNSKFKIQNERANVIHYTWLYPFPTEVTQKLLAGKKRIIDVEQNATGQLASLIREYTGIEITEKLLKYDGRPWFPEEILERP